MSTSSDSRLRAFMDRFRALNERLASTWTDAEARRSRLSPEDLAKGMERIESGLARFAAAGSPGGEPTPERDRVTELAELALGLLGEFISLAISLGQDDVGHEARQLGLELAAWTADQGAELRIIEPVVEAFAAEANALRDPDRLSALYRDITSIMEAIAPAARRGGNPHKPSQAWRFLLMNRAIVATRSLDPALMEEAFDRLVAELPEDAPRFFAEGMGQLDIIGYPPRVRDVMTRYYARYGSTSKTLH